MSAYRHALSARLEYSWTPFEVGGRRLTFLEHVSTRLERAMCNSWGPAIYKWEGEITSGQNIGKRGVLIGETGNLRQRIKQYVSGTQVRGNKLWREGFLSKGNILLYILDFESFAIDGQKVLGRADALSSNNIRLVLEQLLVMEVLAKGDARIWLVNARQ